MTEDADVKSLLLIHGRRLQKLKEQRAYHGMSVNPAILMEIEDIEAEMERLRAVAQATAQRIDTLYFDSRPLLGERGKTWNTLYELVTTVSFLLNDIYYSLDGLVPAFTYARTWILRERATRTLYHDIGTDWAKNNPDHKHSESLGLHQRWDTRSLQSVGIQPGMMLEITWPPDVLLQIQEISSLDNIPRILLI